MKNILKNISPPYKFSLKGGGWDEQRQPKMQPSAEIVRVECAKCRRECESAICARNPLRRSCVSSARNAGESAICRMRAQPSAEIVRIVLVECAICPVCAQPSAEVVRVECAKCRRECDLSGVRDPLRRSCVSRERNAGESAICPVCAQPSAEIVRVECAKCRRECESAICARNPLRRSCVSSARNAGESAIWRMCAQLSAEIVRVECAKFRRECDWVCARATLCGDRACRARNAGTGDFLVRL